MNRYSDYYFAPYEQPAAAQASAGSPAATQPGLPAGGNPAMVWLVLVGMLIGLRIVVETLD